MTQKAILSAMILMLSSQVFGQSIAPNVSDEKRELVAQIQHKLQLDVLVERQIAGLMSMLQDQIPLLLAEASIPQSRTNEAQLILSKEINAVRNPLLTSAIQRTKDMYATAFTVEELRSLVAFYNTPLGNKLALTVPTLQAEAMQEGKREGEKMIAGAMCKAFREFNSRGLHRGMPSFCN